MVHNVEAFSDNELESLHALIVEAMAIRTDDFDDIGVQVFNNWFDRRNADYPGEVWSSWSPAVVAHMAELEPERAAKSPRDVVDQQALATAQTVGVLEGNTFRLSKPIILGVTPGADQENCFGCHAAMGMAHGDVIAVLSSSLDLTAERTRMEGIVAMLLAAGIVVMILALVALRSTLIRAVTGPMAAMTRTMHKLAEGDTEVSIPGTGRRDEIGAMAEAVEVFRQNAVTRRVLEADRERIAQARELRLQTVEKLVARFEASVADVLGSVTNSTGRLNDTADTMTRTVEAAAEGSDRTADGAAGANASVQTVSAAAEELNASISAISDELTRSHGMSQEAVTLANDSFRHVHQLEATIARIADIAGQINAIAEKTNLLALNATIEAARAGESGRGFSVVASEIKQLARHTMQATVDIAGCVKDVTDETRTATTAVETVVERIKKIDEAVEVIAATVVQQEEATGEIAQSCDRAAVNTQKVADSITTVARSIHSVDDASHEVSAVSHDLGDKAIHLGREVRVFLDGLKAA